jgi:hypothetical protein
MSLRNQLEPSPLNWGTQMLTKAKKKYERSGQEELGCRYEQNTISKSSTHFAVNRKHSADTAHANCGTGNNHDNGTPLGGQQNVLSAEWRHQMGGL